MIKRIVKLTFQEEKVPEFLDLFANTHERIRQFNGCQHLELLRGTNPSNIFFTYSYWENAEALEQYRHSDLFKGTWAKTKILFADRPEAWSVEVVEVG